MEKLWDKTTILSYLRSYVWHKDDQDLYKGFLAQKISDETIQASLQHSGEHRIHEIIERWRSTYIRL
jgi:peptidyl-tRNA hydrolase